MISETMVASDLSDTMGDPANFECNICFELAHEPIVTLCGHLYCWPCLYQWLRLHSHSHECPVCKAVVQEEKLIPIYGRGKTNPDPRSRSLPVPNRPVAQRPQTAPHYFTQNEMDPVTGFVPMTGTRFGNLTFSTLFSVLPALFNLQVHGFHDATVYGTTSGVPYLFSGSFHGGYAHGFHHYHVGSVEPKRLLWKMVFVVLGFFVLVHLFH